MDETERRSTSTISTVATSVKLKRGVVREDGHVFAHYYRRKLKNGETTIGEQWYTPRGFEQSCERARRNALRKYRENPNNSRYAYLKRTYGITIEQYDAMLEAQGGKCAICGTQNCRTGKRLAVDHDHITGEVRGVLCYRCNTALGKFRDDPQILAKAIDYLHRARQVSPRQEKPFTLE